MSAGSEQALLVLEVGETKDNRLTSNVSAIWDGYAAVGAVDSRLQSLYTKRRLIDLALGYYRNHVDFQAAGDVGMKLSQRAVRLESMRADAQAEIVRIEKKVRGRRGGASLPLVTTTPSVPPLPSPPFPDANDPRWRGDPYRRPLLTRDEGIP